VPPAEPRTTLGFWIDVIPPRPNSRIGRRPARARSRHGAAPASSSSAEFAHRTANWARCRPIGDPSVTWIRRGPSATSNSAVPARRQQRGRLAGPCRVGHAPALLGRRQGAGAPAPRLLVPAVVLVRDELLRLHAAEAVRGERREPAALPAAHGGGRLEHLQQ